MDRNYWSRMILGRDRGDAVTRSAGRQWLRWWGFGGAFLAVAIFAPLAAANTNTYEQKLRELGEPRVVQVIEVERANAGSRFSVRVEDRIVELANPELTPRVGQEVTVILDRRGRVVLADDVGARSKATGDAAFGVFLALVVFVGLGWGPGMAPYRALRSIRRPENVEQSTIVRVAAASPTRPPQGRVWAAWRRGTGVFYRAELVMPDKRTIIWQGRGPRALASGNKARMVGGGFAGDWVALVVNVPNSTEELVCWPSAPLVDPSW